MISFIDPPLFPKPRTTRTNCLIPRDLCSSLAKNVMPLAAVFYSHVTGPALWKVAIDLEQLGVKHDKSIFDMDDMK